MKESNTTKDLQVIKPQLPIGSIEAYLQRINQIPLLSQEEEYKLATQYQEHGDLQAAQKLVLSHLRYVARVARGYLGYGLPIGDLMQEGTVGLMKAVKRFDPKIGVRLVSFAVHWIKAEIHEYVLRNWRIVKIATTKAQRKLFFGLRSAKKRLGWSTKEEVDILASELGVSPEEVQNMEERLNGREIQFDVSTDDHGEGGEMHALAPMEYLEDARENPAEQLESDNWNQRVDERFGAAFQKLDVRSKNILEKRWLTEEKATLEELAEVHQISPERVRQLEKNAIAKLKALMLAA